MEEVAKVSDRCFVSSNINAQKIATSSNRIITPLAFGLPVVVNHLPGYQEFATYYCYLCSESFGGF